MLNWTRRYGRWAPVRRIEVERVKFDPQLLQNAEISGIEYQQGELAGWETRAYLLEKYQHRCAYCGKGEVETQAKAVNATRYALVRELEKLGLPIGTWSGGRTRWNRARFVLPKTHALDALCVGDLARVDAGRLKTLGITAMGRGR